LHKPQFLDEASRYRRGNGTTKTLSVVVRKVYEGITDRLPEKLHERLKIAIVHDEVQVEGDRYVGVATQEGDYQIEWQDFKDHPLAQGKFKMEVSPFNATNSNCGTCQEYTQIVCNDDVIFDFDLLPDNTYNFKVLENDNICCSPVSVTLVTYDTTYLDSVTVEADQSITVHVKATAPSTVGWHIVRYRAQCANGQYDEADIVVDVDGVAPPDCGMPTDSSMTDVQPFQATLNWTPVAGAYQYDIYVYKAPDYVAYIQTFSVVGGGSSSTLITGLSPNTEYRIGIQSVCGNPTDGFVYSGFAYIDFTTAEQTPTETCGLYELFNTDPDNFRSATFVNCDGLIEGVNIPPLHQREICVLQTSPGVPYNFNTEPQVNVVYLGACL
jgi:hypothetical protein